MKEYILEGYGNKVNTALDDLAKKEYELIDKLKKAGESTALKFNTTYRADYVGKSKFLAELVCPNFIIKVDSLDRIETEAKKRVNGGSLSSYDVYFTVKRTYNLNNNQFNAATKRHTSSAPAGIDADEKFSLADILNR